MHRSERESASLLAGLNPRQREAVSWPGGALLVLAGAGSGKTRVITHRIAHLIRDRGVHPSRVVAVTFTNKAAGEMRERVVARVGPAAHDGWIGTFHSLCVRILRRDGERIGLSRSFNIYDVDDQTAVLRRLLREEAGEHPPFPPRALRSRISRAKNALSTHEDLEARAHSPEQRLTVALWRRYDEELRRAQAVDFDDLLIRTLELFEHAGEVAEGYAERCEQLLVDEYQDTNRPQYLLIRALAAAHGNLCVVGDEDQCIYRFRGAELRNILDFERDHPGAHVIRLEQNYRSTGNILAAAGAVVERNVLRRGKKLWTENDAGDPVERFEAPDDRTEAAWIAGRLREASNAVPFHDMAILYRTNAQSRQFEEILRREEIPYQVVGATQFYERKEIKDLLAYLKLTANPADDVAFRRIVNTPARGIGDTSVRTLEHISRTAGQPLLEAARIAVEQSTLRGRASSSLARFLGLLDELATRSAEEPVAALIERVVEAVDYAAFLDRAYPGLGSERMENVRALVSSAVEFEEDEGDGSLTGFLDRQALVADTDELGRVPGVTLMTVHCAKGLEYSRVFLAGLEESLFPHAMSDTDEDVEEERRLCYVAMTRARHRLALSHARYRRVQGTFQARRPSRFLDEIPQRLVRNLSPPAGEGGFFSDWNVREGSGSSAARAARTRPRTARAPARASGIRHEDGYDVGTIVEHPRFGTGRIVDREGAGKGLKLTIDFDREGRKKILPAYTSLAREA